MTAWTHIDDDLVDEDDAADLEERLDRALDEGDREDARIAFMAKRKQMVARMYRRARMALELARLFVRESGDKTDHRAVGCVRQVNEYRNTIRVWRGMDAETADIAVLVCCANDVIPLIDK